MRRRHSRVSIAGLALAGLFAAVWIPAGADAVSIYLDEFLSTSFSGSDGDAEWASDWTEIGENDGPGRGAILVKTHNYCAVDRCLSMGQRDGSPGRGVYRSVDLGSAVSADLSFLYRRHRHGDGEGRVELSISGDGGSTWVTIRTYRFDVNDPEVRSESVSLDAYLSTDTRIRLILRGGDDGDIESHMNVDSVAVTAVVGSTTTVPVTTTTTTTVPVTTTTVPVTTTTVPVTTTTTVPVTTTAVPVTTTTTVPVTTTTTVPVTTTTTVPVTTTTTTEPPVPVTTTLPGTPGAITTTTEPAPPGETTTTLPAGLGGGVVPVQPVSSTTVPPATTTTMPEAAVAVESGSRPTEGLALSEGVPDVAGEGVVALSPLSRMMADFSTAVEYLSAPAITFVILALVVAWLSVKGLERAPGSRRLRLPSIARFLRR